MNNISKSRLWSWWYISLLISLTLQKEYKPKFSVEVLGHVFTKQKSSAELLVYFRIEFIHLRQEYKQESSVEPSYISHWLCRLSIRSVSRSHLRAWLPTPTPAIFTQLGKYFSAVLGITTGPPDAVKCNRYSTADSHLQGHAHNEPIFKFHDGTALIISSGQHFDDKCSVEPIMSGCCRTDPRINNIKSSFSAYCQRCSLHALDTDLHCYWECPANA